MKHIIKTSALILGATLMTSNVLAAEYTVGQQDKKFTQEKLVIKVGDVVNFKNNDPFSHNVYSLSDAASFDLGSYPKGKQRSVTFDTAGTVEVGCAIHLDMMMEIEVQ